MRIHFEPAVTLPVPRDVGGIVVPYGKRGWRPQFAAVLVTQEDCLAGRIAYGIIRPWRKAILLAVQCPGESGSVGRDLEAKVLIGNDVDPRRRCRSPLLQNRDVFPAVGGK